MKTILSIFLHGIHGTALWAIIASSIVGFRDAGEFVAPPLFTLCFTLIAIGLFLNTKHEIRWWSLCVWLVGVFFIYFEVIHLLAIAAAYLIIMGVAGVLYFVPPKLR